MDVQLEYEKRNGIPEMLGKQQGEFFNTSRYIDLYVDALEGNAAGFVPADGETNLVSPDYVQDGNFAGRFTYWEQANVANHYEGYLAGFPTIGPENLGVTMPTLHFWTFNSDVFGHTMAVPLTAVRALYVHSKLYTDVLAEMEEQSMGAYPRYQVPVLRKRRTGEVYCRDATMDDLERLTEEPNDIPVAVYNEPGFRPRKTHSMVGKEALKHLLDA